MDIQLKVKLSDSELGTSVLFVYLAMVLVSPFTAFIDFWQSSVHVHWCNYLRHVIVTYTVGRILLYAYVYNTNIWVYNGYYGHINEQLCNIG